MKGYDHVSAYLCIMLVFSIIDVYETHTSESVAIPYKGFKVMRMIASLLNLIEDVNEFKASIW